MKKLLLAIAVATSLLMMSCKKTEQENPQPAKAVPVQQFEYNLMPDSTSGTLIYFRYQAPTGFKVDSVYLNATPAAGTAQMDQDYYLFDDPAYNMLYNMSTNTQSMFNKWIVVPNTHNSVNVFLDYTHTWNSLKISISSI